LNLQATRSFFALAGPLASGGDIEVVRPGLLFAPLNFIKTQKLMEV
jgi:hypothetical protein